MRKNYDRFKQDEYSSRDIHYYTITLEKHKELDGKAPAEKCGIKIEGKNKWLTLIQNSA